MSDSPYVGKRIVITGGTGSFGHTVAKALLETGAEQVRVLSRDEAKQDAMRHELPDSRLKFYVGDVRDFDSVDRALKNADLCFMRRR